MKWDYGLVWFWLLYVGAQSIGHFNWFGFVLGLCSMVWYAFKVRKQMDQQLAEALRD